MYIYIQIHWWCIRCPAPKNPGRSWRCSLSLQPCAGRKFSMLASGNLSFFPVVSCSWCRLCEISRENSMLHGILCGLQVLEVALLLRWFDWKLGEGEVLPWRIQLWTSSPCVTMFNFLYLSHLLQNLSRNHHWSPMLRDALQETNTNSSEGSWVVGKMSFPTSIGRICRQFTGGYGISGSPEGRTTNLSWKESRGNSEWKMFQFRMCWS